MSLVPTHFDRAVVSTVAATMLFGSCAGEPAPESAIPPSRPTAASSEAGGTPAPPPTVQPETETQLEYWMGDVALTLATVTYLAVVAVENVEDAPELPGSGLIDVVVGEMGWSATHHWDLGERVDAVVPATGDRIRLVIDDAWSVSAGDVATIAVTSRTRPRVDVVGYVRAVIGSDGELLPCGGATPDTCVMAAFVDDVRSRDPERSTIDILTMGAQDGGEWVDRVNEIGPDESPTGVFDPAE